MTGRIIVERIHSARDEYFYSDRGTAYHSSILLRCKEGNGAADTGLHELILVAMSRRHVG